jgi:hypothetical protein
MLLVLPSRKGVSWDSLDKEGVALDKEGVVRSLTYPANILPFLKICSIPRTFKPVAKADFDA